MLARSNGKPTDWERLYLDNRRAFLACATAWCGNVDDAADLIQEAFFRQLRGGEMPENPRAYVLRSLRNLAIERRRAAHAPEPLAIDVAATLVEAKFGSDAAVQRELLVHALEQLPMHQREAVLLRAVAGLTIAETAAVLEKPAGSVASAYARGIEALQRILNPELTDERRELGNGTRHPAHR